MKAAKKWVLLANIGEDPNGLRNMIAYNLAEGIGLDYSCHMEFADLYLNGTYYGTYQLTEKIEVNDNRMNIGDLTSLNEQCNDDDDYNISVSNPIEVYNDDGSFYTYASITSPSDISGGYVIERNYGSKWEDKPYRFCTSRGECFNVREPSALSKEEMEYLLSVVQSVENAIYSDDFIDNCSGKALDELIDLDSWCLKYLVEEITKNGSAGSTSSYFYLKRGDTKLYAGPAWDYDKSLGVAFPNESPEGLTFCSWHLSDKTSWWKLIYEYIPYQSRVKELYISNVKTCVKNIINNDIETWKNQEQYSFYLNYIRWRYSWSRLALCTVDELKENDEDINHSAEYLKNWLSSRIEFLDNVWINNQIYHNIFLISDGNYMDILFCKDGNKLDNLPILDDKIWINIDNGCVVTQDYIPTGEMTLELIDINE